MKISVRLFFIVIIFVVTISTVLVKPSRVQAFNLFQTIQNWFKKTTPLTPTTNPQIIEPQQTITSQTSLKDTTVIFRYTRPNFLLKISRVKRVTYTLEYTRTTKGSDYLEGLQGGGKANPVNIFTKVIYGGTQSSRYFIPHAIKGGKIVVVFTKVDGTTVTYTATFTVVKNKFVITSQSYQ